MTLRLSHNTQSPCRHLWRYSYFFCVAWRISSSINASAALSSMPMIDSMRTGLRNNALRPFSGWVRTSGRLLGAHDQTVMRDEGAGQSGLVSGIDRLGEVEPGGLDPGVSRERRDGQRHGMTLDASCLSTGR